MATFRILLDGAGTATAISVIKGLRQQSVHDVSIIAMDMDPFNAGRHLADAFHCIPRADDPAFVATLLEVCRQESIDLLIPVIDYGFRSIAASRHAFESQGTRVLLGLAETLRVTGDKFETFKLFRRLGIPTPETCVPSALSDDLEFPCFIKPRTNGRASIDAYRVEDASELGRLVARLADPVIQTLATGTEFTADCLTSLDGSELIEAVVRKRLETKGGLSVKAEVFPEGIARSVKGHIATMLGELPLPGVCNVQGFVLPDGSLTFTEINPRFAGTHAFSIAVGLNTICHILDQMAGDSAQQIRHRITLNHRLKMVRYWNEVFFEGD